MQRRTRPFRGDDATGDMLIAMVILSPVLAFFGTWILMSVIAFMVGAWYLVDRRIIR